MKTKIISARVPVDVYDQINAMADQKGISVSKLIGETAVNGTEYVPVARTGGQIPESIPAGLRAALTAAGGFVVGSITFKAVYANLPAKYTDKQREGIAWMAALAAAGLSAWGINSLMKAGR